MSDPSQSTIRYAGGAGSVTSTRTPYVQVPAGGQAGDLLLLALDVNTSTVAISPPTGVTGWTPCPSRTPTG